MHSILLLRPFHLQPAQKIRVVVVRVCIRQTVQQRRNIHIYLEFILLQFVDYTQTPIHLLLPHLHDIYRYKVRNNQLWILWRYNPYSMDEFMGGERRECGGDGAHFLKYTSKLLVKLFLYAPVAHRGDDVVESKSRYLLTCELFDGNNTSFKAPFDMHPIAYCICSNHWFKICLCNICK